LSGVRRVVYLPIISEFQGFNFVNRIKVYVLISFVFSALSASAQKNSATSPVSFPDSVRIVLENTRKADAGVVSSAFATAWGSLRVDQQVVIQKQVWRMRRKKYPVRPQLVNYFGAIANAVNLKKPMHQRFPIFFGLLA
jgi:hypothetical protein